MSYNFSPQVAIDTLTRVELKMLGAVVLFIIGRWLIRLALALTAKALNRQHLDATIGFSIRCCDALKFPKRPSIPAAQALVSNPALPFGRWWQC
jgi:hypothetical protein